MRDVEEGKKEGDGGYGDDEKGNYSGLEEWIERTVGEEV